MSIFETEQSQSRVGIILDDDYRTIRHTVSTEHPKYIVGVNNNEEHFIVDLDCSNVFAMMSVRLASLLQFRTPFDIIFPIAFVFLIITENPYCRGNTGTKSSSTSTPKQHGTSSSSSNPNGINRLSAPPSLMTFRWFFPWEGDFITPHPVPVSTARVIIYVSESRFGAVVRNVSARHCHHKRLLMQIQTRDTSGRVKPCVCRAIYWTVFFPLTTP